MKKHSDIDARIIAVEAVAIFGGYTSSQISKQMIDDKSRELIRQLGHMVHLEYESGSKIDAQVNVLFRATPNDGHFIKVTVTYHGYEPVTTLVPIEPEPQGAAA